MFTKKKRKILLNERTREARKILCDISNQNNLGTLKDNVNKAASHKHQEFGKCFTIQ